VPGGGGGGGSSSSSRLAAASLLPLSMADRMNILQDVASALGYLRSSDDWVHLNVHPGTVRIPAAGGRAVVAAAGVPPPAVKLSDPAVAPPEAASKLFHAQTLLTPAAFQALRYLPPEVSRKETPTAAADVGQLGPPRLRPVCRAAALRCRCRWGHCGR